jgi:uncharacterized membrane protein
MLSSLTIFSPPSFPFLFHLFIIFYEFDFKIIIMLTMTIIGHDGLKDDASFRKSFSIKEKRELVQAIELLIDEHKVSARQAYLLIGVNQMYYTRFKRIIKKVDNIEHGDVFVPYNTT